MTEDEGLRARLTRQSEDAIGKLAADMLENPMVAGALSRAFDARERATQAQTVAMGALNLPSAADMERLTRRLRSVSQRLESVEDGVDRLDARLAGLGESAGVTERLAAIEEGVAVLGRELAALREAMPAAAAQTVARGQERLEVGKPG